MIIVNEVGGYKHYIAAAAIARVSPTTGLPSVVARTKHLSSVWLMDGTYIASTDLASAIAAAVDAETP